MEDKTCNRKKVSRQMKLYLEVIRNSLTTHSTLKYRERHILTPMMSESDRRKRS